ncbi:MAG: AtpZ/AtpI family protein [Nitrospirae bacterium]|uniref:AtpZ/AtpI family protein n=1 Tax=Candidatus Magnetobacterium casense TaxID=1455061 RepID=UPI000695F9F1|nr:AtpZ/AtpI family protein [Candidatus Magnetobacterium casensis]MBF0338433.1 AtpZ/AtpI family protein [Nitrospirota bacterium]
MAKKPYPPLLKHMAFASHVAMSFIVSVFVGLAIGMGLDRLFTSSPWLTVAFFFLGVVSGFIEVFRLAKDELAKDE